MFWNNILNVYFFHNLLCVTQILCQHSVTKHHLSPSNSHHQEESSSECSPCLNQHKYAPHYRARGCTEIHDEKCPKCAKLFECPEHLALSPIQCFYGGKIYEIGKQIENAGPCSMCSCLKQSGLSKAKISCTEIDCPEMMYTGRQNGHTSVNSQGNDSRKCYISYKPSECCGTNTCLVKQSIKQPFTCSYGGKTYREGERMNIDCFSCVCGPDFDPNSIETSPACNKGSCYFQIDLLLKGCAPVYVPDGCCAIEYHCPLPPLKERKTNCRLQPNEGDCPSNISSYHYDSASNECKPFNFTGCAEEIGVFSDEKSCLKYCTENSPSPQPPQEGKCHFDGENYEIGASLETDKAIYTCTCKLPPDFTCITTI